MCPIPSHNEASSALFFPEHLNILIALSLLFSLFFFCVLMACTTSNLICNLNMSIKSLQFAHICLEWKYQKTSIFVSVHHLMHPRKRQWQPTPVLLPGKCHGQRSLVGCSPWDHEETDTTERFHFHFSLSCIGEGHGNPLQCSCLENPRDGGAWWAAVYGVAQSQTRLKRLSSSSKYLEAWSFGLIVKRNKIWLPRVI